jgi:chromosome segregation ATPase
VNEWEATKVEEITRILRDIRGAVTAKPQANPPDDAMRLRVAEHDADQFRDWFYAEKKAYTDMERARDEARAEVEQLQGWLVGEKTDTRNLREQLAQAKRIAEAELATREKDSLDFHRSLDDMRVRWRGRDNDAKAWLEKAQRLESELSDLLAQRDKVNAQSEDNAQRVIRYRAQMLALEERCKRLTREREEARKQNTYLLGLIAKGPGPSPDPNTCTEGGERGE